MYACHYDGLSRCTFRSENLAGRGNLAVYCTDRRNYACACVQNFGQATGKKSDPVSEALTHLALAISVAPGVARSGPASANQAKNSPAKTIEIDLDVRQLGEIKTLHESGLLSEMEYQSEWEAIMATLKNLSC